MNKNCNIRFHIWPLTSLLFFAILATVLPSITRADALNFKQLDRKWLCYKKSKIIAYLAQTDHQKRVGLSNSSPEVFTPKMALYFSYATEHTKRFWMPEMNFPLDIIFLNKNQQIVGIERRVLPAAKGTPISLIPTTKFYKAKDVVELRSGAKWGKNLKIGDKLSWCH